MVFPPNQSSNFPFHMQQGGFANNMRAFNPQHRFPRTSFPSGPLSRAPMPGGQTLTKGGKLQNLLSLFRPQTGAGNLGGGFLKGAGGLNGALDNVQRVLNVVQQATPLVKEYGPMVKNLPAMYRMMKAFNSFNNEEEESEDAKKHPTDSPSDNDFDNTDQAEQPAEDQEGDNAQMGKSVPKLFI